LILEKNFKRPVNEYNQGSDEYECASLVLETLFKSHPSNGLSSIVNILSKLLLFIPRMFYSIYGSFVPDYSCPSPCHPKAPLYIDVTFSVWEYRGTDVIWASFMSELFDKLKEKYTEECLYAFELAHKKIYPYKSSHDRNIDKLRTDITRELRNSSKLNAFYLILKFITVLVVIGLLIVWSTNPVLQSITENVFAVVIKSILSIIGTVILSIYMDWSFQNFAILR